MNLHSLPVFNELDRIPNIATFFYRAPVEMFEDGSVYSTIEKILKQREAYIVNDKVIMRHLYSYDQNFGSHSWECRYSSIFSTLHFVIEILYNKTNHEILVRVQKLDHEHALFRIVLENFDSFGIGIWTPLDLCKIPRSKKDPPTRTRITDFPPSATSSTVTKPDDFVHSCKTFKRWLRQDIVEALSVTLRAWPQLCNYLEAEMQSEEACAFIEMKDQLLDLCNDLCSIVLISWEVLHRKKYQSSASVREAYRPPAGASIFSLSTAYFSGFKGLLPSGNAGMIERFQDPDWKVLSTLSEERLSQCMFMSIGCILMPFSRESLTDLPSPMQSVVREAIEKRQDFLHLIHCIAMVAGAPSEAKADELLSPRSKPIGKFFRPIAKLLDAPTNSIQYDRFMPFGRNFNLCQLIRWSTEQACSCLLGS